MEGLDRQRFWWRRIRAQLIWRGALALTLLALLTAGQLTSRGGVPRVLALTATPSPLTGCEVGLPPTSTAQPTWPPGSATRVIPIPTAPPPGSTPTANPGPAFLVKDIVPGATGAAIQNLVAANSLLFFTSEDPGTGIQTWWRSDGTSAGTRPLKGGALTLEVVPARPAVALGNTLYFVADDGVGGTELWRSDGSDTGTTLVKDTWPGASHGSPEELTLLGNTLYFVAYVPDGNGFYTGALWRSDGTAAGTTLVKQFADGNSAGSLTAAAGQLFFSYYDDVSGYELWKSNGTAAGTVLVKDIVPGFNSSYPSNLAPAGSALYFFADDGSGIALWRSDGSAAGTTKIYTFACVRQTPDQPTYAGGLLFFRVIHPTYGSELWKSDGTAAGTTLVVDLFSGSATNTIDELTNVNGELFFAADNGHLGRELWKSDGTAAGTVLVADTYGGWGPGRPTGLRNVAGALMFQPSNHDGEPSQSDGMRWGSWSRIQNIAPGPFGSQPYGFTAAGSYVFFAADDTSMGHELWAAPLSVLTPVASPTATGGTVPAYLDLEVTLSYQTTTLALGNPITLYATITNRGNVATPSGVLHDVRFYITSGLTSPQVIWANPYNGPLAPGASVTLQGQSTWTPTVGTNYTITAHVDYGQRILEVNENNNTSTGTVNLQPTPIPTTRTPTRTSTTQPNLLRNGGFENDANPVDGKPDVWSSNSYVTRSSAARHGGSYSMRHQSTANNNYVITQNVANLTAGARYGFSGWTSIPATSDGFTYKLELVWRNSSGGTISTTTVKSYTAATGGAWDLASGTYIAPAGTTNVMVRMNVSSLNATIYADDVAFWLAGPPAPTRTRTSTRTSTTTPTGTGTTTPPTSTGTTPTPSCDVITITGRVYSSPTGQNIEGASIRSNHSAFSRNFFATTDANGFYTLNIPSSYGCFLSGLTVTAAGYSPVNRALTGDQALANPVQNFALVPTPTPATITPSQPDLTIAKVYLEMQGRVGDSCVTTYSSYEVRVVVKNLGGANAGRFSVTLSGRTQEVPAGILAGQSITLYYPATGAGVYTPVADSYGEIVESNEDNNSLSYTAPSPTQPALCTPVPPTEGPSVTPSPTYPCGAVVVATSTHTPTASPTPTSSRTPTSTTCGVRYVTPSPTTTAMPSAEFTGTPREGTAPLMVYFRASAAVVAGGCRWDYGDGTSQSFTGGCPDHVHTYEQPGSYTVGLMLSKAFSGMSAYLSKKDYIVVYPNDGTPPPPTYTTTPTPPTYTTTPTRTYTSQPSHTTTPTSQPGALKVQYRAGETTSAANQVKPYLSVVNAGNTSAPLSELTLRYWYTWEGTTQGQSYWCDWAQVGCGNIAGSFVKLATARPGADSYLELRFTSSAPSLAPGAATGEIQSRFAKSDWSNYTQSGDYSFDPSKTAFADWSRVTLYRNGALAWGVEP